MQENIGTHKAQSSACFSTASDWYNIYCFQLTYHEILPQTDALAFIGLILESLIISAFPVPLLPNNFVLIGYLNEKLINYPNVRINSAP
jgi:hypothetical protein